MQKVFVRLAVLALTVAVVLVPTMARARQRVEYRDATRLSIRHNWLGVAPPSKATVAPQAIVLVPAIAEARELRRLARRIVVAAAPALHPVLHVTPDPLRGPPSARNS